MRILWTIHARDDLARQRAYLEQRNPQAAIRIIKAITASVSQLADTPGLGRPGRIVATRELVIIGTPYVIPYRVRANTVEILRVLHGAQRWPDRL